MGDKGLSLKKVIIKNVTFVSLNKSSKADFPFHPDLVVLQGLPLQGVSDDKGVCVRSFAHCSGRLKQ